jgi:M3 family oligoendopeptidase
VHTLDDIADPSDAELDRRYHEIASLVDKAPHEDALRDAFAQWEDVRKAWGSYANVTRLRFAQDTTREERRSAQKALDERSPRVTALDVSTMRRFLGRDVRAPLEGALGTHAFDLWTADASSFDAILEPDIVRESALTREYTQTLAVATAPLNGEELTLSALAAYSCAPDRELRHAAETARWSIFERHAEQLDAIYDALVTLRASMAAKLDFPDYTTMRYRRMRRVDYGPADVAAYRDDVVRFIVPLAADCVRRFGAEAGFERVYFWDEPVLSARAQAAPLGDLDWSIARTRESLAAIRPELGSFGEALFDNGMFDVAYRPGKRRGAFCTDIPARNSPFIFANYTGVGRDIRTLFHELGHAFQRWQSRNQPVLDYMHPTSETAEIHSMALEFLSWPQMERLFGDAAPAYRQQHLLDTILFIPYGAAVDHFQHLVYAHPGASAAERHAMWREMEARYLPWRDYGDLAYPQIGGLWQEKPHIFLSPFYYIDYTLALCCALQFWERAMDDRAGALDAYVALCGRGGEAPFQTLARGAGLASPFGAGVLEGVAARARAELHA